MSEAGVNSKNPQEAAKAQAKENKKERRAVNAGTQVGVGERQTEKGYVPRFKERYNETIRADLMKNAKWTKGIRRRRTGGRRLCPTTSSATTRTGRNVR